MHRAGHGWRQRVHPRASLATAVTCLAVALLVLGAAGCAGFKPAASASSLASAGGRPSGRPPAATQVRLLVTRDYGRTVLLDKLIRTQGSVSVMKVLAENASVKTAYGGGFVNAIDGLQSTHGAAGEPSDWFYWIDGRLAQVGATDRDVHGGQTVWWDYHDWQGAAIIPAALSAFPAPWNERPLVLQGDLAASAVRTWAAKNHLNIGRPAALSLAPAGAALVVASPAEAAATPWLKDLFALGNEAGIFVALEHGSLHALSSRGTATASLRAAAVATTNPRRQSSLLLIVIGDDAAAVQTLLDRLTPKSLTARVAVGLTRTSLIALPDDGSDGDAQTTTQGQ